MPVGAVMTSSQMDNILTALAVSYRDLMQEAAYLSTQVNGQGAGLAYMQSIGYSNTPNPANPASQSDAAWALQVLAYYNTLAKAWFGTGTITPAFTYNDAVAPLWAGRVGTS